MRRTLLPFAAAALALLAGCEQGPRVDPEAGGAGLMRNLLRAGSVELVAPAGADFAAVRRAAARCTRERDGYAFVESGTDAGAARVVVGCYADARARSLAERLGLQTGLKAGRPYFAILELEFDGAQDALVACFEDPERPGLPLTLYYGNEEAPLARLVAAELGAGWKPSLRAFGDGRELVRGPLALGGRIDAARLVRSAATRAAGEPDWVPLPARMDAVGGMAHKGVDPARLEALCLDLVRARDLLHAWAAPGAPIPPLEIAVYARAEDYTRVAGSAEPAALDPIERRVHVCLAPGLPAAGAEAAARASGRALLGACAAPWLEDGAALDAAGTWWGEPLESWQGWISARGLSLPLESLVEPRADEDVSPHLLRPLRALLFHVLREVRGDAALRELWSGKLEFASDAQLAAAYSGALALRASRLPPETAARRGPGFPGLDSKGRETWRGVESEPSLDGEGWASAECARSLDLARELGANALGLHLSFVARPEPLALPDPLHPRRYGPREGDLQVYAALAAAKSRGMATFLDPDVLASPSGVEDAVWLRVRPEQWQRFFAVRGDALVHAGLLAQLARADVLSIGCELAAVTRDQIEGRKGRQEDLDHKRAGWAEVIARTRRSFEGSLVYIASPVDLPLVLFWKDLDAIGYRLDEKLAPGAGNTMPERTELVRRMRATLEQVAAVANAQRKPWFLARTGFEPTLAGPGRPRQGAGAADPLGMRVQLQALGSAVLTLPGPAKPSASFLWRWPSDPDERSLDPRDLLLARPELFKTLSDLWRVL